MGDVGTHATINHFVAEQMKTVAPATLVPDPHYTYLEFGNYLTDVSQFRDPAAHHSGRKKAHWAALGSVVLFGGPWLAPLTIPLAPLTIPAIYVAGLVGWTHRVFGDDRPATRRHGALAQVFQKIELALSHQAFTQQGRDALATAVSRRRGIPRAQAMQALTLAGGLSGLPPMTPDEVDRVHENHFTQYWPHEHLDFPPVRNAQNHRTNPWFVDAPQRRVQPYIDVHLEALAQQLAVLELGWVRHRANPVPRPQDFMVRLGHLLHAVEDYWFHSNFAELYRWGRARNANPAPDPANTVGLKTLLEAALADGGVTVSEQQRRLLRRRLRYPVYTGDDLDDLSDETSADGTSFVFTGGFGATDIFHTLGKALESMETGPFTAPVANELAESGLTLFRMLLRENERRVMVEHGDESDVAGRHKSELVAGRVHAKLDELHTNGELCNRAHQELRAAFDVDRAVEEEWSAFPGVGGMLIQLLGLMQKERNESERRTEELNATTNSFVDAATENGASGENIGTHSLMAKDGPTSDPFRADAVRLAKHASASVATMLLDRVKNGPGEDRGIDWPAVLRFWLPFPAPAGTTWWSVLLASPATPQPDVMPFSERPNAPLLGPGNEPGKLAALRNGTRVTELENYYKGFES